jgi:hypothetical protein
VSLPYPGLDFDNEGISESMKTVIAHGHIFKNAGTTFDWALQRNFGHGFCDHREDDLMSLHGASYLGQYLQDNPGISAISSHHLCDTSGIAGIDVIPVYILRHPIERILSVYTFERRQDSSSPGAIAAKKYNFKDYVQWRMEPNVNGVIRNYQTIYLAGLQAKRPPLECTVDIFNAAITKVQNSLVGLVEEFDASMVKFEEFLKTRNIELDLSYTRQNVSSESATVIGNELPYIAEELGDIFKLVLSNNSYDLALYCAATQLFRKDQSNDFPEKLADFKKRCAQLS